MASLKQHCIIRDLTTLSTNFFVQSPTKGTLITFLNENALFESSSRTLLKYSVHALDAYSHCTYWSLDNNIGFYNIEDR